MLSSLMKPEVIQEIRDQIRKKYPDARSEYDHQKGWATIVVNQVFTSLKSCEACHQTAPTPKKVKKLRKRLILGEGLREEHAWINAAKKVGLI